MGSTSLLSPQGSAWISPLENAEFPVRPVFPPCLQCAFPITLIPAGAVVTLCWGCWKGGRCSRTFPGMCRRLPFRLTRHDPALSRSCHLPSCHPGGLTGSSLCPGVAQPCPGSTWSFSRWDQAHPAHRSCCVLCGSPEVSRFPADIAFPS